LFIAGVSSPYDIIQIVHYFTRLGRTQGFKAVPE
jgi:hypothetical protein